MTEILNSDHLICKNEPPCLPEARLFRLKNYQEVSVIWCPEFV